MSDRTPVAPVTQLKRAAAIPAPPRRRPVVSPAPAGPVDPAKAPAPRPERARVSQPEPVPAAAAGESPARVRPISLSVPAELLQEFKRYGKRTETSHADVLMDAVAAHRDELEDLVRQVQPATTSDGLFVRQTRPEAGTLSTLSIRMRAANVEALDRLVDSTGAQSRSQLAVAALTAYLRR